MLFFAEPDTDEPQPMGEDSGEVDMSEEAMDKFNDKRSEAMSAFSDGDFQVWPLLLAQLFGCLLVFTSREAAWSRETVGWHCCCCSSSSDYCLFGLV